MNATTSATKTLLDFANESDYPVLFWASVGCPTGADAPLGLSATSDFAEDRGLHDLTGTVDADGEWNWDGDGHPTDINRNTITRLTVRSDRDLWSRLAREYGEEIEAENADAPGLRTTVDQHKGDHEATGLRITGFTEVRTDFSDYFPGIAWGALTDAERAAYREALEEIHAATVELESLDADAREAAKERLADGGISDPFDVAAAIRDAIEGDAPSSYTVRMSDGGAVERETFEAADDDAAAEEARARIKAWVKEGDWGDEGASIPAHWTLYAGADPDDDAEELDSGPVTVEIEPDHAALMRAAGAPENCGHDFVSTYEVDGGIRGNPGVWSHGGTSMSFRSHCRHCGLAKIEVRHGSQRNPGQHDTVRYEMPGGED